MSKRFLPLLAAAVAAGPLMAHAAETPVHGGILNFVVGSTIPSYDAHQETTFGMIHPIRPFYSLLIRVNPEQSVVDHRLRLRSLRRQVREGRRTACPTPSTSARTSSSTTARR